MWESIGRLGKERGKRERRGKKKGKKGRRGETSEGGWKRGKRRLGKGNSRKSVKV